MSLDDTAEYSSKNTNTLGQGKESTQVSSSEQCPQAADRKHWNYERSFSILYAWCDAAPPINPGKCLMLLRKLKQHKNLSTYLIYSTSPMHYLHVESLKVKECGLPKLILTLDHVNWCHGYILSGFWVLSLVQITWRCTESSEIFRTRW